MCSARNTRPVRSRQAKGRARGASNTALAGARAGQKPYDEPDERQQQNKECPDHLGARACIRSDDVHEGINGQTQKDQTTKTGNFDTHDDTFPLDPVHRR